MNELPTLKFSGLGDFQLYDLFLGILVFISLIKIYKRREIIIFKNIFIWLFVLVIINFIFSMFSANFELRGALNSVRKLFSYSFYFVIIANIRDNNDITKLVKVIYTVLIIALAIQFYEVISGSRLVLVERLELRPYWDVAPEITLASGEQVLYIWNRAAVLTYLGLFIAFGYLLTHTKTTNFLKNTNKIIFIFGLIAFILALTRSWLLYISLGLSISLLLAKKQKIKFIFLILSFFIFSLIINQIIINYTSGNINIIQNLIGRAITIFDVFGGSNDSFNVRLAVYAAQIALFLQSPFFGYGFTKIAINEINGDVGVGNTLLQFGLFGFLWVLLIIWNIYSKLFSLRKNGNNLNSQAFSIGLLGAFTGMILGYFFNWDFFGRIDGIIPLVTIMGITDRLYCREKQTALE